MSAPTWLLACCSPLYARALKERSLRPPMSVTIATLSFFLAGVLDAPPPLLELLSSEPQAATAVRPTASSATSIKRIRDCFTCSLLRVPGADRGSLDDRCEQPTP